MKYDDSIREDDFVIRVRPMTDQNEWSGYIDISIITSSENSLSDDSYMQLMHLCKMICATAPIMEQDSDLGEFVSDWVTSNIDNKEFSFEEEKEVEITHEDGNVIRLNFGTQTKGSA